MKKKIGIVILGIIVIIGGYLIYDQTRFKSSDIVLEFNDIKELEYGDEVNPLSFIKKCSGEVIYQEAPDMTKIGKQKIAFVVKEKDITRKFEYEVNIKDTKPPEIMLIKEKDIVEVNDKLDISKYIKSIQDNADGKLTYKKETDIKDEDTGYYTYHSKVNMKKAGKYTIKVLAVDKSNNKSEKEISITVNEKKQINEKKQNLSTRAQSNNQRYTSHPNNKVIVIDPGHQRKGNNEKEAIGPGSSTRKAKVTTGATGVYSHKPESQINLEVGLKLRTELQSRGYTVIMTRTSQNVNLSNQQRAQIGNQNNAAAVIHLHCDGGESSVRGAHTISPAKDNPYCSEIYKSSSLLAQSVIQSYSAATGIKSRGVSYRNDLTGINWSKVPCIYIEMGFISNVSEDQLLTDSSFQNKCAKGIADGIDKYLQ